LGGGYGLLLKKKGTQMLKNAQATCPGGLASGEPGASWRVGGSVFGIHAHPMVEIGSSGREEVLKLDLKDGT
jgi:hypothetical protein